MGEPTSSPYDINGQDFNPDMYLQKLLKVLHPAMYVAMNYMLRPGLQCVVSIVKRAKLSIFITY
jgi:hypothetical protein